MIKIGIDPAFRVKGFAMCIIDSSDKSIRFIIFKNSFLDFMSWLMYERPEAARYCVENSNLQGKIWLNGSAKGTTLINKAVSVGKNQAASQYTVDILKTICGKESVKDISPKTKGKVMNENMFKLLTRGYELINYKGTEDERAAYQCATFL